MQKSQQTRRYINNERLTISNLTTLQKLRILKDIRYVSFNHIASAIGYSKPYVVRVFGGHIIPSNKAKAKLSEFFAVNPFWLWDNILSKDTSAPAPVLPQKAEGRADVFKDFVGVK